MTVRTGWHRPQRHRGCTGRGRGLRLRGDVSTFTASRRNEPGSEAVPPNGSDRDVLGRTEVVVGLIPTIHELLPRTNGPSGQRSCGHPVPSLPNSRPVAASGPLVHQLSDDVPPASSSHSEVGAVIEQRSHSSGSFLADPPMARTRFAQAEGCKGARSGPRRHGSGAAALLEGGALRQ